MYAYVFRILAHFSFHCFLHTVANKGIFISACILTFSAALWPVPDCCYLSVVWRVCCPSDMYIDLVTQSQTTGHPLHSQLYVAAYYRTLVHLACPTEGSTTINYYSWMLRGNASACICLSVCLSVYNALTSENFGLESFHFGMRVNIQYIQLKFAHQGHLVNVKVTRAPQHSPVVCLQLKGNLVVPLFFTGVLLSCIYQHRCPQNFFAGMGKLGVWRQKSPSGVQVFPGAWDIPAYPWCMGHRGKAPRSQRQFVI